MALVAAQNLVLDVESATIARELAGRGIRFVLLKGPTIASWLYGPGERGYGDVDLLLAPNSVSNVEQVLRSRGYERRIDHDADPLDADRPTYAFSWRHRDGFLVEIHQTLVGVNARPRVAWQVLGRDPEELTVAGQPVPVLSKPARALHLALHAAQHGASVEKSLEDLRRGLVKEDVEVWREAYELAVELDAVEAFTNGLALVPPGEEMLELLGITNQLSLDVELHAAHARPSARALEWFRRLPMRSKVGWMVRKVVPSSAFMRLWHPWARQGTFGLVLAYLWRPLWLIKELFLGLRDRSRVRAEMEIRARKRS